MKNKKGIILLVIVIFILAGIRILYLQQSRYIQTESANN